MIIRPGKTAPCELFDGYRVIAEGTHTYCLAMQRIWVMTAMEEDIRVAMDHQANAAQIAQSEMMEDAGRT